jgi:four helix bundle protein
MRDHKRLKVFEMADSIALEVYRFTASFPKEEVYGLTSQIRRAAVSVPSNIVEGCSRESQADYKRFLEISFGSLKELRYQLSLSARLGYFVGSRASEFDAKLDATEKVLGALIRSQRSTARPPKA